MIGAGASGAGAIHGRRGVRRPLRGRGRVVPATGGGAALRPRRLTGSRTGCRGGVGAEEGGVWGTESEEVDDGEGVEAAGAGEGDAAADGGVVALVVGGAGVEHDPENGGRRGPRGHRPRRAVTDGTGPAAGEG